MKKLVRMSAAALTLMMAAHSAHAQGGTCGATPAACTWAYNTTTKVLTITGTGAMSDWTEGNSTPWASYRFSMTSVVISGVTSIGISAFMKSSLTQATISNSVTSIGICAFYGCQLTSIVIPSKVTSMDYLTFSINTLQSITALNPTPVSIEYYVFDNVSKAIPLYVPSGSVPAYKNTAVWKDFNIIAAPEVTFNSQGGSVVAKQPVAPNTKAVQPADPIKDGYTFCGWYRETTCVNEWNFNTVITSNITLFAKWQANQITITYKCEGVGCNPAFGVKQVQVQRNP